MKPFEIVIICVVAVAFLAAVGYLIYRKIKHKGGCDCGCEGCPHACHCHGGEKKENK
ncbi:MAG: FeoB-associated Cys-rich membrane protein [Roseburia sp.]|nr:FeoB-associated Cys-rich membrane protein [Roseburia sp.]